MFTCLPCVQERRINVEAADRYLPFGELLGDRKSVAQSISIRIPCCLVQP